MKKETKATVKFKKFKRSQGPPKPTLRIKDKKLVHESGNEIIFDTHDQNVYIVNELDFKNLIHDSLMLRSMGA